MAAGATATRVVVGSWTVARLSGERIAALVEGQSIDVAARRVIDDAASPAVAIVAQI
jgi:hypothetical protein